jgi:hypothetical protein
VHDPPVLRHVLRPSRSADTGCLRISSEKLVTREPAGSYSGARVWQSWGSPSKARHRLWQDPEVVLSSAVAFCYSVLAERATDILREHSADLDIASIVRISCSRLSNQVSSNSAPILYTAANGSREAWSRRYSPAFAQTPLALSARMGRYPRRFRPLEASWFRRATADGKSAGRERK